MQIVVLDGYVLSPGDNPWDPVSELGELTVYDRTSPEQTVERAAGAEVVLTNKTPLDADTLAKLPDLRLISVLATGYNVVDVEAAARQGVLVANVPEYGTDAVAQYVFAALLTLCHRVELHSQAVHDGEWTNGLDFCFWKTPLVELVGKTIGIVGFGRIGRRTAELARAFGMKVLACDVQRVNPPDDPGFAWADLDELFAASDVVSLHCPQTAENAGMVNADLLGRMKPTAFFINAARGGLVVEADLAASLADGGLAGAALDVVSTEPIAADNPLLAAPDCLITPHVAWATLGARQRLMRTTAENIAAFQAGRPIHIVNQPA
jgi:glycerate dehydrogenase